MEDYAARLRALHLDLTLVLDAVERGLAAAAHEPAPAPAAREPAPATPPREREPAYEPAPPRRDRGAVETVPARERPAPPPRPVPPGAARVEVVPSAVEYEAEAEEPEGAPERRPWTEPEPWEPRETGAWVEEAPQLRRRPQPPPPPPREPPWAAPGAPERRPPPWREPGPAAPAEVEFGEPLPYAEPGYPYPGYPPAPRGRPRAAIPPWLIALAIAGWLAVIALVLVLVLDL